MSWENDDELLAADTVPEISDGELHPAVSQLLDVIQQQEEAASQNYQSLRVAIAELGTTLANAAADSPEEAEDELNVELPQPIPEPVAAPVATAIPASVAGDAASETVLLGSELAADPSIAVYRQQLMSGLANGEVGATGLVGHLLTFRSSTADKMPRLLKEVGEAYYRWAPHTPGPAPMRDALINWLERLCGACKVPNKIRVVQIGDRFDGTRHNAKERGIEVSDVYGWIVLRENGKVFSKATVAVK